MHTIRSRGRWGQERDKDPGLVEMPLVQVPSDIGLSLIVKVPSGWAYTTQTGGHRCLQAWAEGMLIPLGQRGVALESVRTEDDLDEILGSSSRYQGHCYDQIDESDAKRIDTVLSKHWQDHYPDLVRVDRRRLGDSWEAWVHVVIGPHGGRSPDRPRAHPPQPEPRDIASTAPEFWPFYGLPSSEAILTWTNSD